jgi:hypothetical protein
MPGGHGLVKPELAKEICDRVKKACGDKGFALFIEEAGDDFINYMSSCEREGVIKTMYEFLEMTAGPSKQSPDVYREFKKDPDPFKGFERIKLERLCMQIGEGLEQYGKVGLFIFDMEEGGHLAYHTNMPFIRRTVGDWIDSAEARMSGRATITVGGKRV